VFKKRPNFLNSAPTSTESALLKTTLKESRYQTVEQVQENAIRKLRAITEIAFQEAFQQWKKRWERCIVSRGGAYFEGGQCLKC